MTGSVVKKFIRFRLSGLHPVFASNLLTMAGDNNRFFRGLLLSLNLSHPSFIVEKQFRFPPSRWSLTPLYCWSLGRETSGRSLVQLPLDSLPLLNTVASAELLQRRSLLEGGNDVPLVLQFALGLSRVYIWGGCCRCCKSSKCESMWSRGGKSSFYLE